MDAVALIFLLVLAAIWYSAEAILLVFACILFAILLSETEAIRRALTELRHTPGQYDLARRLLGGVPSDEQLRQHVASLLPNAG